MPGFIVDWPRNQRMTPMPVYRVGPETPRLVHRAFVEEDANAFYALNGNREVMRLTGEEPLESVEQARAAIAGYPDFDTVGFGRWACVLKETGDVIGFCGLKHLPELDAVDVGYRFLPEYWGRGIATEACAASLQFGFDIIGLEEILALVLPQNRASLRVLEKGGMRPDGTVDYLGQMALRYVATRSQDRTTGRDRPR
jgi:ribosomal-protein-alanine N-acetyltransferase